uniref:TIL domain containing protein n=1 Tax=Rhipicephalus zambeziensis TaxID=60191 RepID=A0A224YR38_9ACAR
MCTPGCDCLPGWVVDPNNWKKCIKAEASPPLCQPHSRFQPCVSTCEPVCGLRPPKHCFTHCHRGACVCNKGFAALVRNGELICVRQEKCEWYLRTAHLFVLNRTAIAGRENMANNLNSVVSGHGGVLPSVLGNAISSEGTYSSDTTANDNTTIGLHSPAIHATTTSSGNAIGLGSTAMGTGGAGVLSSGATEPGENEAGLRSMLPSIFAKPGMAGVRASGAPSIVSLGPGTGIEGVAGALPSFSMGSIINHGDFTSTGARTRAHIRTGAVDTSAGAAANASILHPAAPGLSTIGAPVTGMTVTGSGISGMVGVGTHPNVRVHGVIAANSGAAPAATVVPSLPAAGLDATRASIARLPGSVSTGSGLSNTGTSAAHRGVDIGSLVHDTTSATGSAVGLLPNAGVRHGAVTEITGIAVPVSLSRGGIGVGAGRFSTVLSSPPKYSGDVLSGTLSGTRPLPSSSAGGIRAAGERAGERSNVVIGSAMVSAGPRGINATRLLTLSTTEVDRIVAGITSARGSRSSDSYRLASLSTLPDGIYSSARGTAMIPSFPAGSSGFPVRSLTGVSPVSVRATTSEVAAGLSAGGLVYARRVGETDRMVLGKDTLPVGGSLNAHALGTPSAGVNGGNVPTEASGPPFSPYGTGSHGRNGVVSTPESLTASIYTPESGTITTGSSVLSAGSGSAMLPVTIGHGAAGGASTHSGDSSLAADTEGGGHSGVNAADGRHTSASSGHRWTHPNTLGHGLNINREHTTSSAGNNIRVLTPTVAVGNGMGNLGPAGAANSNNEISVGGTRGTTNTRTTYVSETPDISRAGVGTEAANNGFLGIHTHLGTLTGASRGGAVLPSTSTDRTQNLATYTPGALLAGTVHLAPAATGAHTGAAGAAGVTGDAPNNVVNVADLGSAKFGEAFSGLYPFVLSLAHTPNTAESTSGLIISNSAFASSLPKPSVPSQNVDIGGTQPNPASVVESANTSAPGRTPLVNK